MRVCLFSDTVNDVNGVSRFVRNVAEQAARAGRDLRVITSTRLPEPGGPPSPNDHRPRGSITNFKPVFAAPMPRYPQLDIVWPPARPMRALALDLKPDAIHVSTPGPVGKVGRRVALELGVPLVGTYHTDFPAYIEHLFDEPACTWLCRRAMSSFYRPFARVFARSAEYARALGSLGITPDRVEKLLPGIDTDTFSVRHRPADVEAFWRAYPGVDPRSVEHAGSLKVLYVGRVSVEKNLPMLTRVWRRVHDRLAADPAPRAQLLVVGDGPYRAPMHAELLGTGAVFLGFRHGLELSRLYAASDLFVFPSTTDTLGQVVMEAQSSGLPVLVTDQGGPAEAINPGKTGLVLPAHDESAWVDAVVALCRDHARRQDMGRAGPGFIAPMSIAGSFDHFWSVHEREVQHHRRPATTRSERRTAVTHVR